MRSSLYPFRHLERETYVVEILLSWDGVIDLFIFSFAISFSFLRISSLFSSSLDMLTNLFGSIARLKTSLRSSAFCFILRFKCSERIFCLYVVLVSGW